MEIFSPNLTCGTSLWKLYCRRKECVLCCGWVKCSQSVSDFCWVPNVFQIFFRFTVFCLLALSVNELGVLISTKLLILDLSVSLFCIFSSYFLLWSSFTDAYTVRITASSWRTDLLFHYEMSVFIPGYMPFFQKLIWIYLSSLTSL